MIYKLASPAFGRYFSVPCGAVDNYIKTADGDFYKILLCVLCSDSPIIDTAQLAERSGVSRITAEDAMMFWISQGVLSAEPSEGAARQTAVPASAPVAQPASADPKPETIEKTAPVKPAAKYSPKELSEKAARNREVAALFEQVQMILGRPINANEAAGFLNIYEYYGYTVPSIAIMTQFAHSRDKGKIAYIETLARNWFEKGIHEYSQVEAEIGRLAKLSEFAGRMRQLLLIEGRMTQKQEHYFANWMEWGFTDEMILLANERCIDKKNRTELSYVNGILKRWYNGGITTPDGIEEKEKKYLERLRSDGGGGSFDLDNWYAEAENYDPEKIGFKGDVE